ncbi:hypothetical protein Daus18300_009829 [Diaporthe australafricana]|uniref:Uncharacterized protein n=1 Tax=Diaporthe australafricana TaxID=127596 RepID=A0ABR3WCV9_9PEZI
MHLNLFMVLASLLLFFTDPGLTDGCYTQGDTWDSIATGASLDDALNELCDRMNGTYDVDTTVRKCLNVGSNRIDAMVYIKKGPGNSINVKTDCPEYGGVKYHIAGPSDDGGQYIEAWVNGDPNHGTSDEC